MRRRWLAALSLLALAGCGPAAEPAGGLPPISNADGAGVLAAVREPGASAVLVNVWATWCVPCRDEFPDLMRVAREFRPQGLRLVLVSADFDDARRDARVFLARQGVDFPSYLKQGDDMEFINALDAAWTGAIPATILFDGKGRKMRFWEGRQTYETFARAVREAIGQGRETDSTEAER